MLCKCLKLKFPQETLPIQNDTVQGIKKRRNYEDVCYISAQKYFLSRFLHKSHRLKHYKP